MPLLLDTFCETAIILAENLLSKRRRKIVDPLILALAAAAALHFRRQLRKLLKGWTGTASSARTALEAFLDARFIRTFEQLVLEAYRGGGAIAAEELGLDYVDTVGLFRASRAGLDALKDLDRTTLDRVQSRIQDALSRGLSRPEIQAELREMFQEWGKDLEAGRAATIGLSEIAAAFNQGLLDQAKTSGQVVRKEWWADPGACDVCLSNIDDVIELDEPFATGDLAPPAHPNCRCSLRLVVGEDATIPA